MSLRDEIDTRPLLNPSGGTLTKVCAEKVYGETEKRLRSIPTQVITIKWTFPFQIHQTLAKAIHLKMTQQINQGTFLKQSSFC